MAAQASADCVFVGFSRMSVCRQVPCRGWVWSPRSTRRGRDESTFAVNPVSGGLCPDEAGVRSALGTAQRWNLESPMIGQCVKVK